MSAAITFAQLRDPKLTGDITSRHARYRIYLQLNTYVQYTRINTRATDLWTGRALDHWPDELFIWQNSVSGRKTTPVVQGTTKYSRSLGSFLSNLIDKWKTKIFARYIMSQVVPYREHGALPLESQISRCCTGKFYFHIARIVRAGHWSVLCGENWMLLIYRIVTTRFQGFDIETDRTSISVHNFC